MRRIRIRHVAWADIIGQANATQVRQNPESPNPSIDVWPNGPALSSLMNLFITVSIWMLPGKNGRMLDISERNGDVQPDEPACEPPTTRRNAYTASFSAHQLFVGFGGNPGRTNLRNPADQLHWNRFTQWEMDRSLSQLIASELISERCKERPRCSKE